VALRVEPRIQRRPLLGPSWPLSALFLGFPIWWALGLGAFIWPLVALPAGVGLVLRGRLRAPPAFGMWLLFLVWALASGSQLAEPQQWLLFVHRMAIYGSATVLFLYVFNTPEEELPSRRVVMIMVGFWVFVVVGGFLGLLFPQGEFSTPAEILLPGSLTGHAFVYELVHPRLAQVHDFLGYAVARPAAPFVYTNEWGANMAVLTPFAFASWRAARSRALRALLSIVLVASVVPIVVSLNRGLWLGLSLGLLYGAARLALRGRGRLLLGVAVLFAIVATLIVATPLEGLLTDRLATPHSNEGRATLYTEAAEDALESPLLGYGSPVPSERNPNLPPVGTHGQFWLVLVSHGIPALILFLGWFLYVFWRSRQPSSLVGLWMHVVVFIALIQMPYYGWLSSPLHIVMVAAAITWREGPALPRRVHVRTGAERRLPARV
jgi:O-antigen ligase